LEEVIPFGVIQIRCNDVGFSAITFIHEFEESVDLFRFEGEISEFVNAEQIVAGEFFEEPGSGAVGQGAIELIEQILGLVEAALVAVCQGLPHEPYGEAGFARAGIADEDDVFFPLPRGTRGRPARVMI
jgi:hypothetical protein